MRSYRPILERIYDFKPVELPPLREELEGDLRRCQDCGVPFCHASGCPLLNAVPEINAAALSGRLRTALGVLLATSPFPEFTARVCPALCEGSCVQGLHGTPVPCRQIEYAVIEGGFAAGLVHAHIPARRSGLRAAVIGSGPAGLAAAWRLNRAGIAVTVYEKNARPGGFLRYGIPDFKLEKSVLDRRVRLLQEEGIVFECGVEAGADISTRLLGERHDVLILAAGTGKKRDLPVPGREAAGIQFAVDYLTAQNKLNGGEIASLPPDCDAGGKRVLVIGGGDTGSDCVGTAWRQGALSVCQTEIMPRPPEGRTPENPWPQWPRVLRTSSSHEEGGERRWNIGTVSFSTAPDEAGGPERVCAANCAEVSWESGSPVPVTGTEFSLAADLVLLAMGFTGAEDGPLTQAPGCAPDGSGRLPRVCALPGGPKAYACGDAALGPSLVVRAVNDGLRTAERILADYGLLTCLT
ncbi:MAG: glutamate synthase subunit beta [Desulfovibrio sp.]|jgi:glutamate synthase (NADPH/NADH) small chain|nr:glutamate synthase subunit beta [Desulfovibrio sp.]